MTSRLSVPALSTEPVERLDRRKQRTRRLLHDSLLALIVERGYDDLTIQDITDRADLRRATFYLHYKDKDELLIALLRETFDKLAQQLEAESSSDALAGKTFLKTYQLMFAHVAENTVLYRTILGGQVGALVSRSIREYLAGHVLRALSSENANDFGLPDEVIAHYIAGVELSLITWWLENGQPFGIEAMAEMTQRLVLEGVMGSSQQVIPGNRPIR
ncbi:MAG: TetR/AcrR family transcriptional regulator [Anaerolineae bacterium]|nr:TetR/AcrR family transcriptional regulator [Anaerolineae bacterium]